MESEITYFLGRFHPLLVHLPIGFLTFGLILESISLTVKKGSIEWRQAIGWAYLGGGISGLMAVTTGWMLAGEGQHMGSALNWHRWMGVAVCVLSFSLWILRSGKIKLPIGMYYVNLTLLVLALLFTGHLGGNLTHGTGYLIEYAPRPLKVLFGSDAENEKFSIPRNPDSVVLYEHLVEPILSGKCMSCHNTEKVKGGLDLTTEESIMEGGDELTAIVGGKPLQSGIFQRVTLPYGHTNYMPPKGSPLDFNEIKILEWWILSGASFTNRISDFKIPEDISWILLEKYGLDTKPKPFFETVPLEPLPQPVIDSVFKSGFDGGVLAEGNNYLRLNASKNVYLEKDWQRLLVAKDHIVMLDLAGTEVKDSDLPWIGRLHNLYSLDLNNTRITDAGLESLKSLERLEILNLYGTAVGDSGVVFLKSLPTLKKVYLWGTAVSDEFVEQWREENEEVEIVF